MTYTNSNLISATGVRHQQMLNTADMVTGPVLFVVCLVAAHYKLGYCTVCDRSIEARETDRVLMQRRCISVAAVKAAVKSCLSSSVFHYFIHLSAFCQ